MAIEIIKVNDGTQTPIAFDQVGTAYEQVVKLDISADGAASPTLFDGKVQGGTINVGTTVVSSGSIAVTAGTSIVTGGSIVVTNGTIGAMPDVTLAGGTVQNLNAGTITRVSNIGTLEVGTVVVSSLPNITQGSIQVTAGTTVVTGGSIVVTAGTVNVGTISALIDNLDGGTLDLLKAGTITRVEGGTLGLITRVGNVGTIEVGTINTLPNIPGGTLNVLAAGTINSATVVVNSATISVLPNLPQGSINVTAGTIGAGTIGGKAASGAAISGNPIPVGGTDSGGTVYSFLTDTAGHFKSDIVTGTLTSITDLANLAKGTVTRVEGGSIVVTAGTVTTTMGDLSGGTIDLLSAGTIDTVGTVTGVGVVSNLTSGSMRMTVGTLTVMPNVPGGTLGLVTTVTNLSNGTIQNSGTTTGVGVVSMLTAGTVSMLNAGTLTTIPNIPGGTIGLVTRVGNIGTLEVGTISAMPNITIAGGTINAGTVTTAVQLGTLNVGTINTGTINAGTVDLLKAGTVTRLEGGSVIVTLGTVGGAAANAAAASGNPMPVGGTDSGGTIRTALIDANGHQQIDLQTGTVTMQSAGTISMINAGTITNSGTTTGVGVVSMLSAGTISMINAGTLTSSGTTTGVGVVSNLTNGSVRITVGTITVLPNIPGGSIAVTAGTMIMTNGTVGAGTVAVSAATISAGTISARNAENVLTYGTQFAATAEAYATLVGSAAVGAGTSIYLQTYDIINPAGTVLARLGFGTALQGTSVYFRGVLGTQTVGGIAKTYDKPVNAGMTNQDLTVYLGAAGTIDVNVSYFIKV